MPKAQSLPNPEAALIIPVPEAESLVAPFRLQFDPSAGLGVPAHITLNYPFTPHFSRPIRAKTQLSSLLSGFSSFRFALTEIRTFPDVIYLAPLPEEPFIDLIHSLAQAFPDSPPYEGKFDHPVPHLTVAQVDPEALSAVLQDFTLEAAPQLPIPSLAAEVWLMDNAESQWQTRAIFPLRPIMPIPPA